MLADLKVGENAVLDVALVSVEEKTSRTGSPYFVAKLADKSQVASAISWNDLPGFHEKMPRSVKICLQAEEYRGTLSFKIAGLEESSFLLEEFVPQAHVDVDEVYDEIVSTLSDFAFGEVAIDLLGNHELEFKTSPAAMAYHHAYQGGLIEHTVGMMRLAKGLLSAELSSMEGIDKELLLVGTALHDVGKVYQYRMDNPFSVEYTAPGRLFGHIVMGAWMVSTVMGVWMVGTVLDVKTKVNRAGELVHIILSHHGKLEWGSPIEPATREAWLVHELDFIDSRQAPMIEELERTSPGNLSAGLPILKGLTLYRR